MKEHIFFRPFFKNAGDCQAQQKSEAAIRSQPSTIDQAALNTPCIVVRGFKDLYHFLSWFQIHLQQPIIFPASQGRYVKQEKDCITICGFSDLEDFLSSFTSNGNQRQSVFALAKSKTTS